MATMMSAGAGGAVGQLSFLRTIDIPFETWVAALEKWQRTERDGELRIGHSLLRGPIEHDRPSGTCRIEVHLAQGTAAPAAPHEAQHRPLVLASRWDRPRTHPVRPRGPAPLTL
jgi:hypothetical protein